MDTELDNVKLIYDKQMESIAANGYPPVHKNFPKVWTSQDPLYTKNMGS